MTRDIYHIASSFKPSCKLCGKQCDSHLHYCAHVDIEHNYNPRRKDEIERAMWRLQNRSKGVRLR